ncbi:hypothetical protein PR003_g1593 [Phytophthora rubi]|nr:hypothetical protein PR002_g1451 [Phytophthora rubi]KAE9357845.1 hypothetical protein PR003_g1593 [Phytophthora rubi]
MKIAGVLVGVKRGGFVVDVEEIKTVRELKQAIKKKKWDTVWDEAERLRLFVAKKSDGLWLSEEDPDVAEILNGMIPEQVEDMLEQQIEDSNAIVGAVFGNAPTEQTIHVLAKAAPKKVLAGSYIRCQRDFFKHLSSIDEVDGRLRFQFEMPLTRARELYVRSSYKEIADQALKKRNPSRRKYVLVTGTAGNGKSVFLYYVLWRLMKDMKRVLILTRQPPLYFDGTWVWEYRDLPSSFDPFWSPDLWCLVDSADPTRIAGFPIDGCSIVLVSAPAASPQRDYIHRFRKLAPTPDLLYMPVWTKEELMEIAPLFPKAKDVWEHRFECLGGIPRFVFQDIFTDPYQLLLEACYGCLIDDCISPVYVGSDRNTYAKQKLIHLKTEAPYKKAESYYASVLALKLVARVMWQRDSTRMKSFVEAIHYLQRGMREIVDGPEKIYRSLCMYAFEPYALYMLQCGGTFKYRRLFSGNKRPLPDNEEDENSISVGFIREMVESMDDGLNEYQLYEPKRPNCAPLDAWVPGFGGFRFVLDSADDIKPGTAEALKRLGPDGNCLYFLLPPIRYKTFTKRTPHTIEQFAICIPWHAHEEEYEEEDQDSD